MSILSLPARLFLLGLSMSWPLGELPGFLGKGGCRHSWPIGTWEAGSKQVKGWETQTGTVVTLGNCLRPLLWSSFLEGHRRHPSCSPHVPGWRWVGSAPRSSSCSTPFCRREPGPSQGSILLSSQQPGPAILVNNNGFSLLCSSLPRTFNQECYPQLLPRPHLDFLFVAIIPF